MFLCDVTLDLRNLATGNSDLDRHMVAVTAKMSEGFSAVNRFRVLEAMRDYAEVLEQPQAVHIDIN